MLVEPRQAQCRGGVRTRTERHARINLPTGYRLAEKVAEVAVPIPDRPGEIAAITTLASELDVNILDVDISAEVEPFSYADTILPKATIRSLKSTARS